MTQERPSSAPKETIDKLLSRRGCRPYVFRDSKLGIKVYLAMPTPQEQLHLRNQPNWENNCYGYWLDLQCEFQQALFGTEEVHIVAWSNPKSTREAIEKSRDYLESNTGATAIPVPLINPSTFKINRRHIQFITHCPPKAHRQAA